MADAKSIFREARSLYRRASNPNHGAQIVREEEFTRSGRNPSPRTYSPDCERALCMLRSAGIAKASPALARHSNRLPRIMSRSRDMWINCDLRSARDAEWRKDTISYRAQCARDTIRRHLVDARCARGKNYFWADGYV